MNKHISSYIYKKNQLSPIYLCYPQAIPYSFTGKIKNVLYKLNCVSQEAFFYPFFAPERNEFKRSLSIEKLKINDLQLIFINYFFF